MHPLAGYSAVRSKQQDDALTFAAQLQDTIVLSSGENVEPAPIEDACAVSPFIQHLVLVGQDRRMLGALVVPAEDAFKELQEIKGAPAGSSHNVWKRAEFCFHQSKLRWTDEVQLYACHCLSGHYMLA